MTRAGSVLKAMVIAAVSSATASTMAVAQELSYSQVERGRYLATASDCIGCHTDVEGGGTPFAGGRGLETPFGIIYSANLTPDEETGLGKWTRDEFYRALNEGVNRHGQHLYPAMPYPYFTLMPRDDVDAIYDYLQTLEPVHAEAPEHELPFPLSIRQSVAGWKMLYFEDKQFVADPDQSAEWNRGRYLVDGPAHCGACHTGKTMFGADDEDEYLRGGALENWFAPNIRGGENGGIAHWEATDIVEFLRDGRSRHTAPMQRMGEVVYFSTQHLHDDDLGAIATYLKSLEDTVREAGDRPEEARLKTGATIYFDNCAGCHAADGTGVSHIFASLKDSNKLASEDLSTVIRIILGGARAEPTEATPAMIAMPPFAWKLTDGQIADLLTYLRQAGDVKAGPVSASTVADMRAYLQDQ
ncbi:MAG: c-type cytochrome [Hoeflea sp.]|nr:c-type cytochrome [Hoeflea sp.]